MSFLLPEPTIILPYVVAAGVTILGLILRKPIAKALIAVLFVRLRLRDKPRYERTKSELQRPASLMTATGIARLTLEFIQTAEPYSALLYRTGSSLFLAGAFWTLYASAALGVQYALESGREGRKADPTAVNYISGGIRVAIVVVAIFSILSQWVEDVSGLITGLGIGGLAIALAAQDTAANLFGSIAIMLDKPFEIGDWVEGDGYIGTVIRVGLRSSHIRAIDQSIISVPNSKLAGSIIANGTKRGSRRVSFRIGIVLTTPTEKIQAFIAGIKEILHRDPDVSDEGILVSFDAFGTSSLEISVIYYTASDYTEMILVKERINFAILECSDQQEVQLALPGIVIYPNRT